MAKESGIRYNLRRMLTALTDTVVESAEATATVARTGGKVAKLAENQVDYSLEEQNQELAKLRQEMESALEGDTTQKQATPEVSSTTAEETKAPAKS
ncbi:hypothetical protein A5gp_00086 [Alteromonas phage vB_AemP_PT15-A5]|nr:hypothetical protein A5gp_00086 [Alteromonas phage vB_AemP_PT15-A5]